MNDDNHEIELDEYKNILSQSKFFPNADDLDDIFKELKTFIHQ